MPSISEILGQQVQSNPSNMMVLTNTNAQKLNEAALWVSGDTGSIIIDSTAHKRISWNDGEGSLALRSGHYYDNALGITYAKGLGASNGGAAAIELNTDEVTGSIELKVAPIGAPGSPFSFTNTLSVTSSGVLVNGSPVLTQSSQGSGNGLDSDLLDGHQGSYYTDASNLTGTITPSVLGSGTPSGSTVLLGNNTWSSVKTFESVSLLGSGNITFKTVNGSTLMGAGDIAFKTVAGTSIVGTGDIVITKATVGLSNVENTALSTWSGSTNISTLGKVVGFKEAKVALSANNIDLSSGNLFTKTISGSTTFTVSNIPAADTVATFVLELTNGGSAVITWWSGVKWVSGTAPTLTAAGRDVLGFFTHDAGTTWTGLLLGKDVK